MREEPHASKLLVLLLQWLVVKLRLESRCRCWANCRGAVDPLYTLCLALRWTCTADEEEGFNYIKRSCPHTRAGLGVPCLLLWGALRPLRCEVNPGKEQ